MLLLALTAKYVSSDRTKKTTAGFGNNSFSRLSQGRLLAPSIWLCLISSCYHVSKQVRPTAALPLCLSMPETAVIAIPILFQQPARAGSPCSSKEEEKELQNSCSVLLT